MHVRNVISALVAGLVFGIGLAVSQMISPAKVIGFLDIAGNWDPSLALVMGGAVMVTSVGFAIARRRSHPLLAESFQWPTGTLIDARLIIGGALFGAGWGIAGYCPGPAIASIGFLQPGTLLFVGAMLTGMILFELFDRRSRTLG
jgi:uncharacterized protein